MQSTLGHSSAVTFLSVILMGGVLGDVVLKLGGDMPPLPRLTVPVRPNLDDQFDSRIDTLFDLSIAKKLTTGPEGSPFFTLHFQPPKKPAPVKKPKTKKYNITFQGVFTNSDEQDKAFLMIDNAFKSVRVGDPVIRDLILKSLDGEKIEIGNDQKSVSTIRFRESATVEIPE